MVKRAGMAGFVAVTVILVLVTAFFCVKTVASSTDVNSREPEEYYLAKERKLTEDVRALLCREGFENSGVMVTRVVEEDGSRLYTVAVHHRRIDTIDEEDREQLLLQLESLTFGDDNCSFRHQFF